MAEESDALDALFAALANRHRREIIYALALQPHSITQLADMRGLSLPAIHKHIRVLEEAQAENFRKMLLAMARDVRVILIKLADRLHNMRTLAAVPPAKRRRVARETMEIYAPIANRLGLNELFHELQELAFSHTHPLRYRVLSKATRSARGNRREVMNRLLDVIRDGFAKAGMFLAFQYPQEIQGVSVLNFLRQALSARKADELLDELTAASLESGPPSATR